MAQSIGTAKIKVNGYGTFEGVDVYPYTDPETGNEYRSVFISDFSDKSYTEMPQMAKVFYRGHTYVARKFGNPNNNRPTYDFTLKS